MELQPKPVAETLMERLNTLIQPADRPLEWGNPLSSTTPQSLAIQDLAERTGALETVVRELVDEVQKLMGVSTDAPTSRPIHGTKRSAQVGSSRAPDRATS
jgi:hypothetical protein